MNKEEYDKNPKICLECSTIITYDKKINKFCNHQCRASHYSKTHRVIKHCKNCNIIIHRKNDTYCSNKCRADFNYKKKIISWKAGEIKTTIGAYGLSSFVRRYIFDKYKSKCCKCGWCEINTKSGKTPLQINHIDGNYKNNIEKNLELLCPNCHALTPNFGSLNKGHGRHNRKRYGDTINNNK